MGHVVKGTCILALAIKGSAVYDTSYNAKGIRKLFLMPSLACRTILVALILQTVAANLQTDKLADKWKVLRCRRKKYFAILFPAVQ